MFDATANSPPPRVLRPGISSFFSTRRALGLSQYLQVQARSLLSLSRRSRPWRTILRFEGPCDAFTTVTTYLRIFYLRPHSIRDDTDISPFSFPQYTPSQDRLRLPGHYQHHPLFIRCSTSFFSPFWRLKIYCGRLPRHTLNITTLFAHRILRKSSQPLSQSWGDLKFRSNLFL